jgi:hypothetical protein
MAVPAQAAHPDRGGQHRAQPPGYLGADGIGQDRISAKRQVAAVILHRSERHHRRRDPAVNELPELACGQLLQLMHAHAHDRSIHHGRRTSGVTRSSAIHIVPICTPQSVNAETLTTAIGRFPITLGSRCVTATKWSSR